MHSTSLPRRGVLDLEESERREVIKRRHQRRKKGRLIQGDRKENEDSNRLADERGRAFEKKESHEKMGLVENRWRHRFPKTGAEGHSCI